MSLIKRFGTTVVAAALVSGAGVAWAADSAGKKAPVSADARFEKKLEGKLMADDRLARSDVDATVSAGAVTLTGKVDTPADKVRAEHIVRVAGAKKIDNQLVVEETGMPTGNAASEQREELEPARALSDPHRKDPLVGTMPNEQTGSREIRIRTTGMKDPRQEREQTAQPPAKDPR
jgi:hypothetical protein